MCHLVISATQFKFVLLVLAQIPGLETPFSSALHLQVCPDSLASFKGLSSFQSLPSFNLSRLDTYHLFETVLWLKITHRLGLLRPWIPDYYIVQIVSNDFKDFLPPFANSYRVSRAIGRRIDPVSFSGDRDGGVGFGFCGGRNFVDVFAVIEPRNRNPGDILLELSVILPT